MRTMKWQKIFTSILSNKYVIMNKEELIAYDCPLNDNECRYNYYWIIIFVIQSLNTRIFLKPSNNISNLICLSILYLNFRWIHKFQNNSPMIEPSKSSHLTRRALHFSKIFLLVHIHTS
jgi:hypothetical protein